MDAHETPKASPMHVMHGMCPAVKLEEILGCPWHPMTTHVWHAVTLPTHSHTLIYIYNMHEASHQKHGCICPYYPMCKEELAGIIVSFFAFFSWLPSFHIASKLPWPIKWSCRSLPACSWIQDEDDDAEAESMELPGVGAMCTYIFINKMLYKLKLSHGIPRKHIKKKW